MKPGTLKVLKSRLSAAPGSTLRTAPSPDSWRAGKTTNERGYTYRWQQARLRFLQANPLCVGCEAQGRTVAASVVDHVIAHRGDQHLFWQRSNWRSTCQPCHDAKTELDEEAGQTPRGAM